MRVLQSVAFVLLCVQGNAQGRIKTLSTDSGAVVLHYYTTGELSTKEWMDTADRWGRSWAWAKDGRELLNYQTRKIAGHASVHFTYHRNGGISKAEVSDAPDGGIQWYRSTTTFDENGQRTGFTEQGHDNDGIIPKVQMEPNEVPMPVDTPPREVVTEQRMFVNEVFVVNPTKWTCIVAVQTDHPAPDLPTGEMTIEPGDTLRIGTYSTGVSFQDPKEHVRLFVYRKLREPKSYKMARFKTLTKQVTAKHRLHFNVMRGWVRTEIIW